MTVDSTSPWISFHQEQEYRFCSKHCKIEFDSHPESYLQAKPWYQTYYPLILIAVYLLGVVFWTDSNPMKMMAHFMSGFFLIFSFFKLLNLRGFVDAYRTYDLLAKKIKIYAWIYPFLELALGLAYLKDSPAFPIHLFTFVLMILSSIGVIQALLQKNRIECACLGTVFKLPMSKVTLTEDLLMAAMSLLMIYSGF